MRRPRLEVDRCVRQPDDERGVDRRCLHLGRTRVDDGKGVQCSPGPCQVRQAGCCGPGTPRRPLHGRPRPGVIGIGQVEVTAAQARGAPRDDEWTDHRPGTGDCHGEVRDIERHGIGIGGGIRVSRVAEHVAGTREGGAAMALRPGVRGPVLDDIAHAGAGEDECDRLGNRVGALDGHLRALTAVDRFACPGRAAIEVTGGDDLGGDQVAQVHRRIAQRVGHLGRIVDEAAAHTRTEQSSHQRGSQALLAADRQGVGEYPLAVEPEEPFEVRVVHAFQPNLAGRPAQLHAGVRSPDDGHVVAGPRSGGKRGIV